jgi:hypothetical protein
MKIKRALIKILLAAAGFLFGYCVFKYSLYLAASRIYQVDECQNVFVARILATSQAQNYFTSITLYLAPLVWLARDATRSADLFASARLFSLLIFWINLLLIATATGARLFSRRWLIALMGAATLAPLWDYGFEIRQDNLLLTGLLLSWCVVRVQKGGLPSYFIFGALTVAMEFTAFKAFVYTFPLAFAVLVFPPFENKISRWKLALAWGLGALGTFMIIRVAYGTTGIWDIYLNGFKWASKSATDEITFGSGKTLSRLLTQTPLLLVGVTVALVAMLIELWRRRKSALSWEGNLPEAGFFLLAFAALIINPAPHPYNLVNLVPFAFLLCFRYVVTIIEEVWNFSVLRPLLFTLLLFAHLVPFFIATWRHLNWPNHRQGILMALAEDLTDPARDSVYDGVGMVPTRSSIHYNWFIHSLNIQGLINGPGSRVSDMLAVRPAAVIIPNYRTDWLRGEDQTFIREHYVSLADDFWVLGKVLDSGGGTFEIIHPGRYRISTLQGSNLVNSYPEGWKGLISPEEKGILNGALDGQPLPEEPVEFKVGTHYLETSLDKQVAIVWVGPQLNQVHRLGRGNHHYLFTNWY